MYVVGSFPMICGLRFRLNVIGYSVCLSASLSFIFHLRSDQVQLNSRQEYTHSIKFPSGSRQYTLLILPLAPVLITMPSSLFSLPRSTNSTPASINFFLTSLTSSSVKKHMNLKHQSDNWRHSLRIKSSGRI